MKLILKLEELAMFALGIYMLMQLPVTISAWLWVILFFSPDIGMLGYLINTSIGAITYNLFHHKGIALLFYGAGIALENNTLQLIGLLLFTHSSFDRIMGYGLKYSDNFEHTHLGTL